MAMNTKNADEPYSRSILQDKQDLPELESCGGCCVFSGSFRVMQRPELGDDEKTRGGDGGGARAARDSERRKMTEKGA